MNVSTVCVIATEVIEVLLLGTEREIHFNNFSKKSKMLYIKKQ